MSDKFVVKDSGKRRQFNSGMVRDTIDDKINYLLIRPGPMYKRWAAHLTKGAVKYSEDNWLKAQGPEELAHFLKSCARHFEQWLNGETDEDHASAVYFNINGVEYIRQKMREAKAKEIAENPDHE